ncbi:MAG: hypothetical protein WBD26_07325, partial [Candidatus Acidiferrales bacterium]
MDCVGRTVSKLTALATAPVGTALVRRSASPSGADIYRSTSSHWRGPHQSRELRCQPLAESPLLPWSKL